MTTEATTTPATERGVRRGVRQLPVVLTPDELAHVAQEMARITAELALGTATEVSR